jgi:hypothetical protein
MPVGLNQDELNPGASTLGPCACERLTAYLTAYSGHSVARWDTP